jgi:hypothetical protein
MLRRYLAVASLTPILAAMIAGLACGQEPRPAPRANNLGFLGLYRPSPDQLLTVLRFQQVQTEVSLTNDQNAAIAAFVAALPPAAQASASGQGKSQAAPAQTPAARAQAIETGLGGILQPAQLTRLKQIRTQMLGTAAFFNLAVAATLQLTDAQKASLRQIDGATFQALKDLGLSGVATAAWQNSFRSIRNSGMQQALAVLTANQQATFATLTGATFHLNLIPRSASKAATQSGGTSK